MRIRNLLGAWALAALSLPLWAQASAPLINKPVTIVIAFTPGGAMDVLARLMADKLRGRLSATVIVENKPGANGAIANQFVRQKPADGSTLYLVPTAFSTAPATEPAVHKYDPARDFTPVARLGIFQVVTVASAKAPFNSVPSMLAYAAANPGKVTFGTTGSGSNQHLGAARLEQAAKIKLNIIHYKGSAQVLQDMISGEIHFTMDSYGSVKSALTTGLVKTIAQTGPTRAATMPDVPTMAETVPGYELSAYFGMVAPPGMSAELANRLGQEVADFLRMPDVIQRLKELNMDIDYQNPEQFGRFLTAHLKAQQAGVNAAGLK